MLIACFGSAVVSFMIGFYLRGLMANQDAFEEGIAHARFQGSLPAREQPHLVRAMVEAGDKDPVSCRCA